METVDGNVLKTTPQDVSTIEESQNIIAVNKCNIREHTTPQLKPSKNGDNDAKREDFESLSEKSASEQLESENDENSFVSVTEKGNDHGRFSERVVRVFIFIP